MAKNYKSLVEKTFKVLHPRSPKVFIPELNENKREDWGENAIVVFDKEDSYKKGYSPQYAIFQAEDSLWYYAIETQTFGGSYWEPEEWDMVESERGYAFLTDALYGLIEEEVKDTFNDLCLEWQMSPE